MDWKNRDYLYDEGLIVYNIIVVQSKGSITYSNSAMRKHTMKVSLKPSSRISSKKALPKTEPEIPIRPYDFHVFVTFDV
jgi:hypothetical protein